MDQALETGIEGSESSARSCRAAGSGHLFDVLATRCEFCCLALGRSPLLHAGDHRSHQAAVRFLHGGHLRKGAGQAQGAGVAGEHARDHGIDQYFRGLLSDTPAGEVMNGFVDSLRALLSKGLEKDPQAPARAENRAGQKSQGPGG